jgi:MoaA/NifB/PqqE/SkfB family radical SAM enzyme
VVERQLPLMTSRNCPFRCNFCTNQALDLPWRAHTVEHFVGLMTRLRLEYGVDRFLFLDDNINVDKSRFRELVRALAETAVPWDAVNGFRADQLDREMIRAIRSAGNTKITVSAESGDPELLKTVIRKGLKLSSVIEVARLCQEEKIPLQVHYVVGIPGETKTQINKTLEFASMLFEKHGAWPLLQHAIPFPGTQLFADCEANGCFVRPPFDISGSVLEVESIIRTDAFEPQEVVRMKRNGQHLHAATQALTFLDIGGGCDNDCLACTCTPGARESPARSATELYEDLERARFLGARELFIGGGEPTRRTDLPAIVERARELGFERVGLLTNAHGLSDRPAAEHLLAGVDRLVVVLHAGTAAVHDTVAGRAGSYVETMAGIRNASTAGVAHLEIHAAVTTDNLTSLPGLVDLARMVKAQGVTLQVPPPDSPAFARGCVAPWDRAEPWVVAAAKRAQRGFVEVQGVPLCLLRAPAGLARPSPPWLLQRTRPAKSKHPVCKECVAFILCGGFYRPEHDAQYAMIPAASLAT